MTQSAGTMRYRPEIDGMRALAIVPVMLFHAGISTFSGGFVGVDVFFVISGYLITLILLNDLAQGRLSIAQFYERRARRILPALLGVILVFSPFAVALMVPEELRHFSRSLVALAAFASNFFFWQNTGYFDPGADTQPFLHTWSLAVEEQFYIIFPLLLMFLMQRGARVSFLVLAGLSLASLSLAQSMLAWAPSAAYFLLPTRAWELLLGALMAFLHQYRPTTADNSRAALLAGIGIALVVAAILLFNRYTPHPGVLTLAPTLGAALAIRYASPDNGVGRMLALRPVVGIGLLSYSAYLIHQPLLALARLWRGAPLPVPLGLGLVLCVLPLSWISWRFLETPARRLHFPPRRVLQAAAVSLVLTALVGSLLESLGPQFRLHGVPTSVLASIERQLPGCPNYQPGGAHWLCRSDPRAAIQPTFLLLGDSHMHSLAPVVIAWARSQGIPGAFAGLAGCPPLLGVYLREYSGGASDRCFELNRKVLEFVRLQRIRHVVLVARWSVYTGGEGLGEEVKHLGLHRHEAWSEEGTRRAFVDGFRRTLEAYRALGVRVDVLMQVPQQPAKPLNLYRAVQVADAVQMRRALALESVTLKRHAALQSTNRDLIQLVAREFPGTVRLLDPVPWLCGSWSCPVGSEAESNYRDESHLSVAGATQLLPLLTGVLQVDLDASSHAASQVMLAP